MSPKKKIGEVIGEVIEKLTVGFKTGLRTDGEFTVMWIEQFDSRIELTKEQALSLERIIKERISHE